MKAGATLVYVECEVKILFRADTHHQTEVAFFHDAMQTYLTVRGQAGADTGGYRNCPRPKTDDTAPAWDRSRVFLGAAASSLYNSSRGARSELFDMCLSAFQAAEGLPALLVRDVVGWGRFGPHLMGKTLTATFEAVLGSFPRKKGETNQGYLRRAAVEAHAWGGEHLAALYSALAPVVVELVSVEDIEDLDEP